MQTLMDRINHHTVAKIEKWDPDQLKYAWKKSGSLYEPKGEIIRQFVKPYEVLEIEGNLVTTAGLGRLTDLLIGTGSLVTFGATTTRIGVGSVATAAAVADVALGGDGNSTTAWYQVVDSAPTRVTTTVTNDTVQSVATFASADGNFAWAEWGINLGAATVASSNTKSTTTGFCFFNHKIASMGTKASGAAWTITCKNSWS